jgi:hypothetical protein
VFRKSTLSRTERNMLICHPISPLKRRTKES